MPLKVRRPPSAGGVTGQASVTVRLGAPCTAQVAAAEAETSVPVHLFRALAVRVEVMAQALFAGTV